MKSQWILLIAIIILTIFIITVTLLKGFVKYKPQTIGGTAMADLYKIPSPWGWPIERPDGSISLDQEGNKKWAEDSAVPVQGPEGICKTYTWIAFGDYIPGFPMLKNLSPETSGDKAFTPIFGEQSCVDEDQMNVIKKKHMCRGDSIAQLRTSGECLGNDGLTYEEGEVEEFWTSCGPLSSPRCTGNIGFFVSNFNLDKEGFDKSLCFDANMYTLRKGEISNVKITLKDCNMMSVDVKNTSDLQESDSFPERGFPSQLFRIIRYKILGNKYVPTESGEFFSIVHRPTGGYVLPSCDNGDIYKPLVNKSLTIVMPDKYKVPEGKLDPKGAWWYSFQDGLLSSTTKEWIRNSDVEDIERLKQEREDYITGLTVAAVLNPIGAIILAQQLAALPPIGEPIPKINKWEAPGSTIYLPDVKILPMNYNDPEAIWSIFVEGYPDLATYYDNPDGLQRSVKDTAPLVIKSVGGEVRTSKLYIKGNGKEDPNVDKYGFIFLPTAILPIIKANPSAFRGVNSNRE